MPEHQDHFPPQINHPALSPARLPFKLRGLVNENNKGSANDILEAAAFALERVPPAPKPVTFSDLEKLMRDAITTFRGLEEAARKVPALTQQVNDLTRQLTDAKLAATTAKDAQTAAENALAAAQANAIPAGDLADGNTVLDQLATPAGAAQPAPEQKAAGEQAADPSAVGQQVPPLADGNAASNQ